MAQVVLVGITWSAVSPTRRVSVTFPLTYFRRFSFATVGMFSAVTNLGGGGIQDVSLSDTANGVLYGTFALTGLISGGINNGSFGSDQTVSFSEHPSDLSVYSSARPSANSVYCQFNYPLRTTLS
jgi:hypothetical protein